MAKGFKTGGRRKGSVNRTSKAFKEATLRVFKDIGGQIAAVTELKGCVVATDPVLQTACRAAAVRLKLAEGQLQAGCLQGLEG